MTARLILSVLLATSTPDRTWTLADAGSLGVPIAGLQPARRLGGGLNGMPFAPAGLGNCDEMNFYREQAGLPSIFSSIGWRESNCRNEDGVHTSCCYGYWQLHKMHFSDGNVYDRECDVRSRNDVDSDTAIDKQRQACAAAILYRENGLAPWRT